MLTNHAPMLWLKPKLNLLMELVLLFIKCWLQGHCYQEHTILLLPTLGQRYDELLRDKSWRFYLIVSHLHPVYACAYTSHPLSHPGTPGTLIWKSWRGCSSQVLVSLRAFRTIFLPIKVLNSVSFRSQAKIGLLERFNFCFPTRISLRTEDVFPVVPVCCS